jgi:hypothetical protein
MSCYVYDNSSTQNFSSGQFYMGYRPIGSTSQIAASATTIPATSGASTTLQSATSSSSHTFNDTTNNYLWYTTLTVSGADSTNLRFYGCDLNYTVADTDP